MGELWRRFRYLITRRRLDAELEADMEFHREMAALAGRNNFGNMLRMQEQAREAWGWTWLDSLLQDCSYALRTLRKSPGFTLTAVLVLAIGIGANVAAFSAFNLMALRPLPVPDPGSLVRLQRRSPEITTTGMPYFTAMFYADHAKTLSAVLTMMTAQLDLENDHESVKGIFVSANFFTQLGTSAAYGRVFRPNVDDAPNAAPAVILGHRFWQQRFAADPGVVGKVIHLNHKPVSIIGVEPYGFPSLDSADAQVWLPMTQQPYFVEGSHALTDTSEGAVRVWARLAPGASAKMAEQELLQLTNELRNLHPSDIWKGEFIRSDPGGRLHVMEPEMYRVAALVGTLTLLILAIACANLGGLLLARGVSQEREIGIRLALGANRWRIFRQLFTESLLLAVLGSAVGMLLASVTLRIALMQADAPPYLSAAPDWRVFLFVVFMILLTSALFGLAPALQIARQRHRRSLARQLLVGTQIAASCVLLVVASLLVRAAEHALHTNPGFGFEHVLAIDSKLVEHGYSPAAAEAYLNALRSRIQALPGVTSVAFAKRAPLGHTITLINTVINGHKVAIYANWVDPDYFDTMEIPLLAGRNFLPGESHAMIVSESLARKQWPGESPLGKKYWDTETVVGISGNAHTNALNDGNSMEAYQLAQFSDMPEMVILVKSTGEPDVLTPIVRSIVQNLDPKLFPDISPLKDEYRRDMSHIEQIASVVSMIGLIAVALAAIGILGLVAYTVSQRMKEIAIRIALGAERAHVLMAILRQFRLPVFIGIIVGTATAAGISLFLGKILYGVNNFDPASYFVAILVLTFFVAIAALLPARRALRADVAKSLHYE